MVISNIHHHQQYDNTNGAGTAYLPVHQSSSRVFSWVRVDRSLVLCVCFVDRYLSICPFSFDHCVVCSSIYVFWLSHIYLQTYLRVKDSWLHGRWNRTITTLLIIPPSFLVAIKSWITLFQQYITVKLECLHVCCLGLIRVLGVPPQIKLTATI